MKARGRLTTEQRIKTTKSAQNKNVIMGKLQQISVKKSKRKICWLHDGDLPYDGAVGDLWLCAGGWLGDDADVGDL